MSLFSPITMLLLARTLARGRKSVSNLAHSTAKSRGVPASGGARSWDCNDIVRPRSLSLPPLHLVSPSSDVAPFSDRLSLHRGKMVTASPSLYPSRFKSSRKKCSLYFSRACTNLGIQSDNTSTNHCSSFY